MTVNGVNEHVVFRTWRDDVVSGTKEWNALNGDPHNHLNGLSRPKDRTTDHVRSSILYSICVPIISSPLHLFLDFTRHSLQSIVPMPPFRNFLGRRPVAPNSGEADAHGPDTRFSEDSHRSSPLSIRKSNETEPPEYKLSVVDVNGDYLPPSPPEKESFWRKYPGMSRSSSNHRNLVDENEPFSISRESFDSYRRSFDISARSPVVYQDAMPSRTSLDSRFSRMNSQSSKRLSERHEPEAMEEEGFEDVGLEDEEAKPKKKGIFSRFGDFTTGDTQSGSGPVSGSKSSHMGFHIPGRKRPQAPPVSEMGAIRSPVLSEVREG
ncbi:hypothetical protein BJX99DRAFT_254825 [Aspergillus californicus]